MTFSTHAIMSRVATGPESRGGPPWEHAQTANIGGMGVRALVASDMPMDEIGGLEFSVGGKDKQPWATHPGLGPMLESIRRMSTSVREHMEARILEKSNPGKSISNSGHKKKKAKSNSGNSISNSGQKNMKRPGGRAGR